MNIDKLKEVFTNYVNNYNIHEKAISKKYYHSLRVMDLSREIATYNSLSELDIELATVIGLLHDYGRFEQWSKFHTYNDTLSIDHGDLAVLRLFKENAITKYYPKEKYYPIIYNAIKYHNKYCYPKNLTIHSTNHCKIIRDADKLDIFQNIIKNNSLKEDQSQISENITTLFYQNKPIDYHSVTNSNDIIILYLAMIFDLNYQYSYKYLYHYQIVDKLYASIKNKHKFKKYFEYINKYINERID